MNSMQQFWPVVVLVAVGVFLVRLSFFWLMDRITITPTMKRILAYIPAAVLPAIVAPAVVYQGQTAGLGLDNLRIWAALIAVVVAWRTQNIFATIAAGFAMLFLLRILIN